MGSAPSASRTPMVMPIRPSRCGTLDRALELGCTLLDTADSYGAGENERWLGSALEGRRDAVVLGTKVGLVCDQDGKVVGRDGRPESSSSRDRCKPATTAHRFSRPLHTASRRSGSTGRGERRRDGRGGCRGQGASARAVGSGTCGTASSTCCSPDRCSSIGVCTVDART